MSRARPALGQELGGQNGGLVAAPVLDRGDQAARRRIGELVELAPQQGGRGLGVAPGGGDVLVAEEALHVGDLHAQREQPGRHSVAQEVRVDPLGNPCGPCHLADDLADPLPAQDMRHRPRALLSASEQRAYAAAADVQLEELGELAADRHLAPLAALAAADDDHASVVHGSVCWLVMGRRVA